MSPTPTLDGLSVEDVHLVLLASWGRGDCTGEVFTPLAHVFVVPDPPPDVCTGVARGSCLLALKDAAVSRPWLIFASGNSLIKLSPPFKMFRGAGIEFGSFDILTDEEVRAGLKILSNRPTYPQVSELGCLPWSD